MLFYPLQQSDGSIRELFGGAAFKARAGTLIRPPAVVVVIGLGMGHVLAVAVEEGYEKRLVVTEPPMKCHANVKVLMLFQNGLPILNYVDYKSSNLFPPPVGQGETKVCFFENSIRSPPGTPAAPDAPSYR